MSFMTWISIGLRFGMLTGSRCSFISSLINFFTASGGGPQEVVASSRSGQSSGRGGESSSPLISLQSQRVLRVKQCLILVVLLYNQL